MRSMFNLGIQKVSLGQVDWLSALVTAGVQSYKLYSEEERLEEEREFKEEQAAINQAREDAALKFQQDMMKNIQDQNAPKPAGTPGVPGQAILGMKPVVFYSVAGLTAGALILGTIMLTKGN